MLSLPTGLNSVLALKNKYHTITAQTKIRIWGGHEGEEKKKIQHEMEEQWYEGKKMERGEIWVENIRENNNEKNVY